jgi:uncharacterized protein YgiM (DUF1202 family)
VKVTTDALNVRKGSGTGYEKTGCIRDCSTYTIMEEKSGWGDSKAAWAGSHWPTPLGWTARP